VKEKLFLLVLALCCGAPAVARNVDDYPLEIVQIRVKSPPGIRVAALNRGPATVTVRFDLSGENLALDRDVPLIVVVPARAKRDLVTVSAAQSGEDFRFNLVYDLVTGDAFTPPDEGYFYRLPLAKGVAAEVVQEPHGMLVTHLDAATRYAVDFAVPEGTAVVAARAGVVIEAVDRHVTGGPDPAFVTQANYVAVMHPDRSIAYYYHLAPRGALVRPGQQVRAGDRIALSGNTGYSSGPHLHFDVRRAVVGDDGTVTQESIPVAFHRASGGKIKIGEGVRVVAD